MADDLKFTTALGSSDLTSISLLGRSLTDDLMGKVGFAELTYWMITLKRPTPGQLRMFETVLVTLADHGLTPSALATRLTLLGAPESVQGALAAGILGGGSRYLGVTEDSGKFLAETLSRITSVPNDDQGWDEVAREAIRRRRATGTFVPGLGHPTHKNGDPRIPVIFAIARECGTFGPHLTLFEAIGRVAQAELGRSLPLNGAGVCGAALADAGIPIELLRGVAVLTRCAGLLGHIAEELRNPLAADLYRTIDEGALYDPPA